jgi:hypothetical protein
VDNPAMANLRRDPTLMQTIPAHPAIDAEVLAAARRAARDAGTRFVVGWWSDGAQCRLMLLPEDHRLTGEPAFLPLAMVEPADPMESRAA